jgi:hypothetical protein
MHKKNEAIEKAFVRTKTCKHEVTDFLDEFVGVNVRQTKRELLVNM